MRTFLSCSRTQNAFLFILLGAVQACGSSPAPDAPTDDAGQIVFPSTPEDAAAEPNEDASPDVPEPVPYDASTGPADPSDAGVATPDAAACDGGECTPSGCIPGSSACACRAGDQCDPGLSCRDHMCFAQGTTTVVCGSGTCSANEYCDRTAAEGPVCTTLPCANPSSAMDASGQCSSCGGVVGCKGVVGATGRFWPFKLGSACVCETEPNYFLGEGGLSQPVACDADGDRWVRDDVRAIPLTSDNLRDQVLIQNMRCSIQTVDRVRLRDEYGMTSEVVSCATGLVQDPNQEELDACVRSPIRLLESARNDVALDLSAESEKAPNESDAPPYGKRAFQPEELNALTKACVSAVADFNDDGQDDVGEAQVDLRDVPAPSEDTRLASFSYFMELYTSRIEAAWDSSAYATLVIEERSRCDAGGFPLFYDAPEPFAADRDESYWRTCARRRDPYFGANTGDPGFDFAQWTRTGDPAQPACPETGSCPVAPPPHASIDARVPGAPIPYEQGLCQLEGAPPADGLFRGLNHHSQFKCVQAVEQEIEPFDRALSRLGSEGELAFNLCSLKACDEDTGSCPRDFACESPPYLSNNAVGWAATRYVPYTNPDAPPTVPDTSYQGGCINEDVEWSEYLCPDWTDLLTSSEGGPYGRFSCDSWGVWGGEADGAPQDKRVLYWSGDVGEAPNGSTWSP